MAGRNKKKAGKLSKKQASKPTKQVQVVHRTVRGRYDAAQTNHVNQRWWAGADDLSAIAANNPAVRKTLRKRSRYEFANNSYCNGIVQTLANDLIGTGPRLQMLFEDSQANQVIEAAFDDWANEVRLPEKLRTLRTAEVVDGEGFILLTTNPKLSGPVKLDLKPIEADQIASPDLWQETELEVDGIKFDQYGNPIQYSLASEKEKKLPAEAVIHSFRVDRPGQVRGIPQYTAALDLFAELRRFTRATVLAAETAASFPMVVQTTSPNVEPADIPDADTFPLENGEATTLPAGWSLGQMKAEHPTTTYAEFKKEILNEIARCMSMPLNVALGNSAGYNYASGRLDHQVYFKALRVLQSMYARCVLDRIFQAWLREALMVPGLLSAKACGRLRALAGLQKFMLATCGTVPDRVHRDDLLVASDWLEERGSVAADDARQWAKAAESDQIELVNISPHTWFWDGNEHVDPKKEADAQAVRLANHTTTLAHEYARQGRDWEVELRQRARENQLMKELGLSVAPPSTTQNEGDPEGDDDAEGDGKDADE